MSKIENEVSSTKVDIDKMNILYDNVLVKPKVMEEIDDVLTPQQYEDKPEFGEVIKVGEGRIFDNGTIIPLKVQPGDIVYFNKYSTTKMKLGTIEYHIIREEDIVSYQRG